MILVIASGGEHSAQNVGLVLFCSLLDSKITYVCPTSSLCILVLYKCYVKLKVHTASWSAEM
jgi:hypothetical protein